MIDAIIWFLLGNISGGAISVLVVAILAAKGFGENKDGT